MLANSAFVWPIFPLLLFILAMAIMAICTYVIVPAIVDRQIEKERLKKDGLPHGNQGEAVKTGLVPENFGKEGLNITSKISHETKSGKNDRSP